MKTQTANVVKTKKEKKNSNPFVIIFILIAVVYALTFIIPSGQYTRIDGILDPNSFHFVDKIFVNPIKVLFALPVMAYQAMGKLFITMMIVGATLRIVQDTGALDLGIYSLTNRFQEKAVLLVPILLAFTGFLGTASVLISTVIAFIPLGLTIARRLEVDNIFAVAVMFLGSYTGFMASPISPVSTAVAQELAGIPVFSGFKFRLILTIILLVVLMAYLTFYAQRVRKDKSKSVMKEVNLDQFGELKDLSGEKLTFNHILVLIIFFGGFAFFCYGSSKLNFGVSELASIMLPVAIVCGLIGKLGINGSSESFIKGAQSMAMPIMFMIFAMAISVILNLGGILDTIIYYVSIPLSAFGPKFAAIGMFIANSIINLGITSGSGQAAVVMPIMAPLADVVGITRQTAVLAYQLGDGFTNLLNPINVFLIASLGMVKASMKDWFKLVLPIYLMFFVVICIALSIAVSIGWA
ncbi:YfcC family protein [Oceanirhabdus seepicola]|uniref:YfcC family protein n=1 Tax=Oceanirhabdus seepicola TaxID=2828781 RepID=A0A9J6P1P7_9CLOT|nr:Na+/H+ antiporter NhaC family protein [Oceanirhabdus seepicola]MCM1989969.1 YfcC family protein [Oceanirhabdus seepicola]